MTAMRTRTFATVLGILLAATAALGFAPPLLTPGIEIHPLSLDTPHAQLFGLFPVNPADNLVHLALGIWGIVAGRMGRRATTYARIMAGVFAALTLGGFLPMDLLPLYGNDIWLHGLLTLVAAYFGWVHRNPPEPAPRSDFPA